MDEEKVNLKLTEVEAMVRNPLIRKLMEYPLRSRISLQKEIDKFDADGQPVPDWMIAGLNCQEDGKILPVCIHAYLVPQ